MVMVVLLVVAACLVVLASPNAALPASSKSKNSSSSSSSGEAALLFEKGSSAETSLLATNNSRSGDEQQLPYTCPSRQLQTDDKTDPAKCSGNIPNINDPTINRLLVADTVPMLTPSPRAFHTGVYAIQPQNKQPVMVRNARSLPRR